MNKISLFPNGTINTKGDYAPAVKPSASIDIDEYLDKIRDGEWQDEVLQYRAGKRDKLSLSGVTASGVFTYRNSKSLVEHSGMIAIDIDQKDHPVLDFAAFKLTLQEDPIIYGYHHSAGGFGLVCYVRIATDRHLDSFLSLERYFCNTYKITIDKSCKNIDRYRFNSYDPDTFTNKKARLWKSYLKKAQIEVKRTYVYTGNDIDYIMQQIADTGSNIAEEHQDWRNIAFALFSKFGEAGRDYFHHVSTNSTKYSFQECDDLYTYISKRTDTGITIGSFFWYCTQAGISIKTERTQQIERVGKAYRKKAGPGSATDPIGAAKVALLELHGIAGPDVDEALEIVKALPEKDLNEKSNNSVADLKAFIGTYDFLFNQVTRNYELDREPVNDRTLNSMYIKGLEQVDPKLKKETLMTLIESDCTKEYNPMLVFFEKHKHLAPTGNYEKLVSCIDFNGYSVDDSGMQCVNSNYVNFFLKKWLLSVIASMHGTYSLLILVLTGPQGNNKTNFFRELLPDELMPYYSESKLDEGKDSEILMTKKIIIMDDEFGGKSKQDAKRLKELSSRQTFSIRRPYGKCSEDLNRLAVLCGTSNEEEVINDLTGNRRIIPVNVINIDMESFRLINKVDLFIELYHEYIAGGNSWMLTKEDVKILNMSTPINEQPSQEQEIISNYVKPCIEGVEKPMMWTNTDIKNHLERETEIKINSYKLGLALKSLGFQKRKMKLHGVVKLVYFCTLINSLTYTSLS